jgi:hypothetical protein
MSVREGYEPALTLTCDNKTSPHVCGQQERSQWAIYFNRRISFSWP